MIFVAGKIDVNTVAAFRKEVAEISAGASEIIFDFREVNYISSAGLRELLICRKKFPDLKIENVRPEVFSVFSMTGFDSLIPITLADDLPKTSELLNEPADNGDTAFSVPFSFQKLLSDKAANSADKAAVVYAGESYTWQDINRGAAVIAADLAARGVRQGSHVAICGANSINWILTFFGIQKLGAIAVLMNFKLCAREIAALVRSMDVTHICCGEMVAPEEELKSLCDCYSIRDGVNFKTRSAIKDNFCQIIREDEPAVMIFTSGTTGKLKGVILSAYNILNAAKINSRDQRLCPDDKACVILPFFHIFGLIAGLFANALAGVTIYLPVKIRTDSILELINREKCTTFHSVPTMLLALINNKDFSPEKLSSLRCSIISGARATEAQIKTFRRMMPQNHFLSSYGLSEMAPVSITDYDDSDENILYTVGKIVKNIKIKIDNPDSQGIGEILVQGFNLMTGYYKLALDEQPINAEGWLHTGDLGVLDGNGYLRLTGRIKEIIIRGGENIYPAEVEAAIAESECIDDVKVFGVPDDFFGEAVCACVKLKTGEFFDADQMQASLCKRLAKFKVPAYFLVYEDFPMLGSGKTDLAALRKDVLARFFM
jgi:fatty-acyl-CoA synthase